jgi:hypothetical protein
MVDNDKNHLSKISLCNDKNQLLLFCSLSSASNLSKIFLKVSSLFLLFSSQVLCQFLNISSFSWTSNSRGVLVSMLQVEELEMVMVGVGRQGVLLTLYCKGGQLLLLSGVCLFVVEVKMVVVWQVLLVMVGSRVHGEEDLVSGMVQRLFFGRDKVVGEHVEEEGGQELLFMATGGFKREELFELDREVSEVEE